MGKSASAQDAVAETSDMDIVILDDFTYAMYRESRALSDEDKSALLDTARLLKISSPKIANIYSVQ